MNFCDLPADMLTELMKYWSTYEMRKLMTVNKKMSESVIAKEVGERITEEKLAEEYGQCGIKARHIYDKMMRRNNTEGNFDSRDAMIKSITSTLMQSRFLINGEKYGIHWRIGPNDLYLEEKDIKSNEWQDFVGPMHMPQDMIKHGLYHCRCGSIIKCSGKSKHLKSKRHIERVDKLDMRMDEDYRSQVDLLTKEILRGELERGHVAIYPNMHSGFEHNWVGHFLNNPRFRTLGSITHYHTFSHAHTTVDLTPVATH
jgi:hypothetical protein